MTATAQMLCRACVSIGGDAAMLLDAPAWSPGICARCDCSAPVTEVQLPSEDAAEPSTGR